MTHPLYPFWLRFPNHTGGCIEAPTAWHALATGDALGYGEPESCHRLPYPADPRIGSVRTDCPSLCWAPEKCAGFTSCQRWNGLDCAGDQAA
jgi:hypothetical protein